MTFVYILMLVCALVIGICMGIIYEWREAKAIRKATLLEVARLYGHEMGDVQKRFLALIGEEK